MDDDVALHGAVGNAERRGGLADDVLHLLLDLRRKMAGQVAAVFDEEGRVALQIFVIAVGEAGREAAAVHDHRFGRDLRTGEILLDHDALARRVGAGEQKSLLQIGDLGDALHAARTATIDRFDDEIVAALDGDALQRLRRRDFVEPRHRHAALRKAALHRELVTGQFRGGDGDAGQAEFLRHGRGGNGCVGGDADHAVELANLAAEAFGGGGGLGRPVNVGDQAGIGERETGRGMVDVRHHDIVAHFLGAFGGVRRLDAAGDDQQGLAHQKYSPPLTLRVCAVM